MDFQDLITERYSVRKFKTEHLQQDIINKIIESGHKAPTGCNYQPQRILVINTEESLQKLYKCTKCHFNAPTAMLVCYNQDESWKRPYDGALSAPIDAVIVTTHMMLAAHDMGVGSCWVMHFDPYAVCEAFNIPENIKPCALLVMGYPTDDAKPLSLHSESRPLSDVVFYDTF